jgi:hypothetical protein
MLDAGSHWLSRDRESSPKAAYRVIIGVMRDLTHSTGAP